MDILHKDKKELQLQIKPISQDNPLWQATIQYAQNCSWKAGPSLAKQMQENKFVDWEKVFVVLDRNNIAGYCTLTKTDCIPDISYTPYIGYIFVGEEYRGNRLSEKLITAALAYAKDLGFDKVYLVSDHINLYEKYGFIKIDEKKAPSGAMETIFMRATSL